MRIQGVSVFLLMLFIGGVCSAQTAPDTALINRKLDTADKTLNPDSAIILYNAIIAQSTNANYADAALKAIMRKGIKYEEKGDYMEERNCCNEALKWASRSSLKDAAAWCYNGIGSTYLSEGDYMQASVYLYKALDEVKKMPGPPTHTTANVYNTLGMLNARLNLPDKAIAYFKMGEEVARKQNLDYQLANSLTLLGEYYNDIHKPDSAIALFNEVMNIGRKLGKVDLQAQADYSTGMSYLESKDYAKAIQILRLTITLAQNSYPYIATYASISLGDALCHSGQYKEAEAILEKTLKEVKAQNDRDNFVNCYSKLIDVYRATGQYKKALDLSDSMAVIKDTLTSTEKMHAINQLEFKYETAEKDKQLAQSQLLIVQQQSKLTRKNIWIISIGSGILLLCVFGAAIFMNQQNKQRLQAAQIKSLQHENTISILKGVVQGEEKERSRIARELHDGIGGMLSAAMMRMMSIRHEREEITMLPAYRETMDLLDEMGNEIRETAHNLMPEVLLKQSLPDAILNYCNNMQKGKALQIDFQSYGSFDNITQKNKLNIYRIVQEMLKNIAQHANATHALVQLLQNKQLLTITVEDNGSGFNTEEIKKGIGLHNLKNRVNSMSGHFTVESEMGKGASVYIEFDMHKMTTDDNL